MFRFTSARRTRPDSTELWNLAFASVDTCVPVAQVQDRPALMMAAVEDLCWQFTLGSWKARRPARGNRAAHAAWVAELQPLLDTSHRLRHLVQEQVAAL
jgi:hypothetical protein